MGKDIYVYLIIFTKKSKTTCPINCVIESYANSPSVLIGSVFVFVNAISCLRSCADVKCSTNPLPSIACDYACGNSNYDVMLLLALAILYNLQ